MISADLLLQSAIAAIGIAQLAIGPQKCVLVTYSLKFIPVGANLSKTNSDFCWFLRRLWESTRRMIRPRILVSYLLSEIVYNFLSNFCQDSK